MKYASGQGRNGKWPPKKIGQITVVDTDIERLRLPSEDDANAVGWFIGFITWVLKHGPKELSSLQLLVGTVLATEAITNRVALLNALSALENVRVDCDGEYASWMEAEVSCRVRISCYTKIAASRIKDWSESWEEECDKFFDFLIKKLGLAEGSIKESASAQFFKKSIQWFYYVLPGPCANDLAGVFCLTVLPDGVLDRSVGIRPPIPTSDGIETIEVLYPLMDVASDQLWGTEYTTRMTKEVVIGLKQIFRNEESDICRLANFLQKRTLEKKLRAIASLSIEFGSPIDSLLILWVIHLFEWGSVRLRNPTIGTIRAYVLALIDLLHEKLHEMDQTPTAVAQESWEKFFIEMVIDLAANGVAISALKSFHRFLVVQLGIDPVSVGWGPADDDSMPRANVLWPDEAAIAFRLITSFTSDVRLQFMLAALISLGCDNPVRIGDLPGLTTGCFNRANGRLRVDIAHRLSQHSGKSDSATRPLDYTGAPNSEHITRWLDYREMDGEVGDDVLVFGDPNQRGKCYRLGLCLRLLNQILKSATGDSTASFHMLRHTCITRELRADLLEADVPHSIATSKRVAAKAGHSNDQTSYVYYFHSADVVTRFWIDHELEKASNSVAIVAPWLNCLPNSLTVSKGRYQGQGRYLEMRLRGAAFGKVAIERSTTVGLDSALIKSVARLDAETSFQKTMHIMTGLRADLSLKVIASRNDVSPEHVVQVCWAVINVACKVIPESKNRAVASGANDDHVCEESKKFINDVFCHFPIQEQILESTLAALRSAVEPDDGMRAAALAWQNTKQGKYINLENPEIVAPLVKFLITSGVPASNFFIRIAVNKLSELETDGVDRIDVEGAQALFISLARTALHVADVSPQGGRPNLYLMLCRNRIELGKTCSSADSRTNRVHALMLTLAVWIEISKKGV
jgi:integrase